MGVQVEQAQAAVLFLAALVQCFQRRFHAGGGQLQRLGQLVGPDGLRVCLLYTSDAADE